MSIMNPSPGPIHRIQPFPQYAGQNFAEKIGVPGQDGAYWLSPATEPPEAATTRQRPVPSSEMESKSSGGGIMVIKQKSSIPMWIGLFFAFLGLKYLLK